LIPELNLLIKQYSIDCKLIYIAEAHAENEWPIGNQYRSNISVIKQHETLQDRRKAAKILVNSFTLAFPVYLDDPTSNAFQNQYSPWPFRWYVIDENGILKFIGQPNDASFSLKELAKHLE